MTIRVLPMGDCAFTVEYSDLAGLVGAAQVRGLRARIEQAQAQGQFNEIVDMVSASRSLTIWVPPAYPDYDQLVKAIVALAQTDHNDQSEQADHWSLPVCYQGDYAPDLDHVATATQMSCEDVIACHLQQRYTVLQIGFLPGFPFMGGLDQALHLPRRFSPRTRVPAGSLAIANDQTAIYPWDSPGGWHLIGRCPLLLFDPNREAPSLLKAADQVSFHAITQQDYQKLEAEIAAGHCIPESFKVTGATE